MSKKRKFKKHWGWVVAILLLVALLLIPVAEFQQSIEDTEEKLNILQKLIVALTTTAELTTTLVVALAALIFYKVLKNR